MTPIPESYQEKATFFDKQVTAPWAAAEYGADECTKLKRLQAELGDLNGKSLLEPGCGTGRLTEVLSKWVGNTGHITALDISANMIAQAQNRLAPCTNVTLRQAAFEDLNPAPGTYDVILHHQVFPHYNDQPQALKISARAVKPGGSVIIFHFIDLATINDIHRKAGTAVENDKMPNQESMRRLFASVNLNIKFITNDIHGYLLIASRPIRDLT